ncbi:MAG: GntR family transcriptional regulator [Anaerolineae bacterium]|nr:GntR family transcriptional regulator [Anaerolineae bacterium]
MINYKVDPDDPRPRYYQVYASLKARIEAGEFPAGTTIPSERQLTEDYGVSRITIVKALDLLEDEGLIDRQHGKGNFVVEDESCVEDCTIAFCVPTPSESYIFTILLGATRVAMHHHVRLQIVEIGDGEEEVETVRALIERGFDGVLLFSRSIHLNTAFYRELQQRHYPFVLLDRYCPEIPSDYVGFDDEQVTYQLTEILIKEGHRRIALLISSEAFATSVHDRLRGYRRALEDHRIAYNERWVGQTVYDVFNFIPDTLPQLQKTYVEFLAYIRREAPTAIVAINNYSAEQANDDLVTIQMELMQAMINAGVQAIDYELKIPLASISHKMLSLNLMPLRALAMQSGETLGEKAIHLLLDRLHRKITGPPKTIIVPMKVQMFN